MRFALALVTVLAVALAGCGDGTDTSDTSDTSDTPTPTDDTAADDASDDQADAGDDTEGDCSAAGLPADGGFGMLGDEARATAAFLLDAAVRCDEQLLFTAATESDTTFFFGSATFDGVFGLPEDADQDPAPWEALARLLNGTTPVEADGVWAWPAAFSADAGASAWQELVDSGLYSQAQVEQLRSAPDGYLGWRVGIDSDGTWLFFTAGD